MDKELIRFNGKTLQEIMLEIKKEPPEIPYLSLSSKLFREVDDAG